MAILATCTQKRQLVNVCVEKEKRENVFLLVKYYYMYIFYIVSILYITCLLYTRGIPKIQNKLICVTLKSSVKRWLVKLKL